MNLNDLRKGIQAEGKRSTTDANVANQIEAHLRSIIPEAFEVPGVWVSGSNVWKFLYGQVPAEDSDIDVICEPDNPRGGNLPTPRTQLVVRANAEAVRECQPSVPCDVNGGGMKYRRMRDGRTIDMWNADGDVIGSLRRYPEHSHAHCRAAYNCHDGVLIVLPNPKAP